MMMSERYYDIVRGNLIPPVRSVRYRYDFCRRTGAVRHRYESVRFSINLLKSLNVVSGTISVRADNLGPYRTGGLLYGVRGERSEKFSEYNP